MGFSSSSFEIDILVVAQPILNTGLVIYLFNYCIMWDGHHSRLECCPLSRFVLSNLCEPSTCCPEVRNQATRSKSPAEGQAMNTGHTQKLLSCVRGMSAVFHECWMSNVLLSYPCQLEQLNPCSGQFARFASLPTVSAQWPFKMVPSSMDTDIQAACIFSCIVSWPFYGDYVKIINGPRAASSMAAPCAMAAMALILMWLPMGCADGPLITTTTAGADRSADISRHCPWICPWFYRILPDLIHLWLVSLQSLDILRRTGVGQSMFSSADNQHFRRCSSNAIGL